MSLQWDFKYAENKDRILSLYLCASYIILTVLGIR